MSSKPIALRRTAPDAQPVTTIAASDYTISINGTSVNPSNISWVSSVTMAAPSTSNIYFGKLPSFYNSNISSINPCYDILIGDFVVLNKNHEYDSWDNTGSDFYNKGPPTECLSVGGDAVIENKLGIGTSSPVEKLHVYRNTSGESNVHIQAYSDTTGDRAALYLGTPHSNDPNAQPKCAIIADAVGWSRADLHFCVETTADNGTAYRASTSNSRMMIDGLTGYVGIGTSNPQRTLDVNGDSRFDSGVFLNWSSPTLYLQDTDHRSSMVHCNSGQFYILNGTGTNSVNWAKVNGRWALQIDLVNNDFGIGGTAYAIGYNTVSDIRIKKDIVDIDDTSALEKLRLIQPKTYKYRNEEERGSDTVYGFIAQDVSNVLPYAVKLKADPVPTILSSSNVTALTDTSVQLTLDKTIPDDINLTNTSNIFITVDGVGGYACPVISTTGNNIITIERTSELSNITSTSNAYIFGEYVQDFHTLDKNAIFTIATAALQEVDRQLQAEKTKVATLETQVADLLARVTALENN